MALSLLGLKQNNKLWCWKHLVHSPKGDYLCTIYYCWKKKFGTLLMLRGKNCSMQFNSVALTVASSVLNNKHWVDICWNGEHFILAIFGSQIIHLRPHICKTVEQMEEFIYSVWVFFFFSCVIAFPFTQEKILENSKVIS